MLPDVADGSAAPAPDDEALTPAAPSFAAGDVEAVAAAVAEGSGADIIAALADLPADAPAADIDAAAGAAIARLYGEPLLRMPTDLYIPPDALEIFLDAFEGPLDLLLYLIRRQNFNILDIPMAEVTKQYMEYVELMKEVSLELAAEYLVMAALLAEIKSRMLLPRPESMAGEEEDPRAELIRRLQE